MHVRLAQREDIPAILAISNWAALHTPANFAIEPETLESWLSSYDQTHQMFPWLVAEDGAKSKNPKVQSPNQPRSAGPVDLSTCGLVDLSILGFAKASPHRSRCAYAWSAEVSVYVHPDHHGKGIGTALYARLIPMLKAQGYVTLIAGITTPNPASEKLHEAFGFKRVGTFFKVGWKFGTWYDVGYWQAMLREGKDEPTKIGGVTK